MGAGHGDESDGDSAQRAARGVPDPARQTQPRGHLGQRLGDGLRAGERGRAGLWSRCSDCRHGVAFRNPPPGQVLYYTRLEARTVRRLQRAEGGGGQGHTLIQASLWGQEDDLGGWVSPQAGPGQLDTGGLDVPVDDALRVGAVQCGSDLFDHPRGP